MTAIVDAFNNTFLKFRKTREGVNELFISTST